MAGEFHETWTMHCVQIETRKSTRKQSTDATLWALQFMDLSKAGHSSVEFDSSRQLDYVQGWRITFCVVTVTELDGSVSDPQSECVTVESSV